MKAKVLFVGMLFVLASSTLWAANKAFSFECRTKVIRGGHVYYEHRQHTFYFKIDVISDNSGRKRETLIQGLYPFIVAMPGERYSIRIYNPLPVKAAVNLSIDGLNSVTGDPCSASSGSKWVINPRSHIVVSGWQVSRSSLRRFYFTSKERSYAAWRSNEWGTDLTVKCGMIAAAFFWNRRDIERYFERYPIIEGGYEDDEEMTMRSPQAGEKKMDATRSERSRDAGTGMGEKQQHVVHSVNFTYNMGMYNARNAVKIYYDFTNFPYGDDDDERPYHHPRYAPEPDDNPEPDYRHPDDPDDDD